MSFILYIHDLPQYIKHCFQELFADNATVHLSDTSVPSICNFLKADFLNFLTWCEDNDMKPNIPKTKTMFILSKQGVNKIMAYSPVLEVAEEQLHVSESEKVRVFT